MNLPRSFRCVLTVLVVCSLGCGSSSLPKPKAQPRRSDSTTATTTTTTSPPDTASKSIPTTDTKLSDTVSAQPEQPEQPSSAEKPELISDTTSTPTAPAPDVAAERIMLLTPDGPLLIDLQILLDGQSVTDVLQAFIDDALKLADDDGDGQVTWDQLFDHPRFRYGQFGNPRSDNYAGRRELMATYDTTQNDRVDRDEMLRYLTNGQGFSNGVRLSTSNSRRITGRDESPIWQLIDSDRDGYLSLKETEEAAVRLRLRDREDDEILYAADFLSNRSADPTMAGVVDQSRYAGPMAAQLLHEKTPWGDLRVAWDELYRFSSRLEPHDLGIAQGLFAILDLDNNQSLAPYEFEMLLRTDPHIAVRYEFQSGTASRPSTSRVQLAAMRLASDNVHGVVQNQSGRLTISLPRCTIDFYLIDQVDTTDYAEQARSVVQRGDEDNNGYLSMPEFEVASTGLGLRWEAADLDTNGMVYAEELATLLAQGRRGQQGQVRVIADDQSDILFPVLDQNHDGRLDSRELDRIGEQLASHDQNLDGRVSRRELPSSLVVGVSRGLLGNNESPAIPLALPTRTSTIPRWFQGMDRNQDGTIAWREFLGTRTQFDAADTDQDGFLEPDEVP